MHACCLCSQHQYLLAFWNNHAQQALQLKACVAVQYVEVDLQQLQIKLKHEPRHLHEAIEADYTAAAKLRGRRPIDFDGRGRTVNGVELPYGPSPTAAPDMNMRRLKKRCPLLSTLDRQRDRRRLCFSELPAVWLQEGGSIFCSCAV